MKVTFNTPAAPKPIGPYSQAAGFGNMIFLSGQIALDPASGKLVNDSIQSETEQVMKNISAVLKTCKASFSDVVKTSIFLSDMKHFSQVNEVYARYFEADFPARETVAVAGLPMGVNVEISMIVAVSP